MTADLEAYDELYDEVKVGSDFEEVPDGTYQVFVDEIKMTETKAEPVRPMLAWQLKIMHGAYEGRILFKNAVVNIDSKEATERSLKFIKTDLSICGLKDCKFSEIQGQLVGILNVQLEIKVLTKTYKNKLIQNVWIQKRLETSTDDIPF